MKKWDVVIVSLLLVAVGVCFVLFGLHVGGERLEADIYLEGELYGSVLLGDEEQEFLIETQYGYNRVVVSEGGISVSEANCGSQTCVKTRAVSSAGGVIACVPHKLMIKVR